MNELSMRPGGARSRRGTDGGRRGAHALRLALLALALSVTTSCAARRELVILSEPSGAQVRLDNQVVGWTPYTTTFEAYGTRRVTLYREGYRSQSMLVDLNPPWFGVFPFDVFSEVVVPVGWQDRHVVELHLEPESGEVTEPDLEVVLRRAETLRMATPEGPLRTPRPAEPPPKD
ncbi:MAG: PEGA domain-containing protein [Planctomycetes bacterium]|nr:PEGA domain-containing protein [Planctomycetota bacterium]